MLADSLLPIPFWAEAVNTACYMQKMLLTKEETSDDDRAFEEEKRNVASQKRAAQATSINKLSNVRSSVSTATTPYVSTARTPIGANADESSFEEDSDAFQMDGIFNRAYDDEIFIEEEVEVEVESESEDQRSRRRRRSQPYQTELLLF
ncbi:hypothetical protein Tco_0320508 [Tanacetum coccineum]